MRLWHQSLIPLLPTKQLLGQHRECCALRGKGWYKKHSTVQYALNDKFEKLVAYHFIIIDEAEERNIHINNIWKDMRYRGRNTERLQLSEINTELVFDLVSKAQRKKKVYAEHNIAYLHECLLNLREKGIDIDFMKSQYGELYV